MTTLKHLFAESFVPLVALLVLIVGAALYVDQHAEALARAYEVIVVSADVSGGDADEISEGAAHEAGSGAVADPSLDRPSVARARAASRAGDQESAMAIVSHELSATPDDPALLNEFAVYAIRAGQFTKAVENLDKAITARPDYARALFNRAVAQTKLDHQAEARAGYVRVLELDPNYFEATLNLGYLLLDLGELDTAIATLRRATKLGGNEGKARAFQGLGLALSRDGQREPALAAYEHAIEYRPGYLLPRVNQALLLMGTGTSKDRARAEAILEQTVTLQPDFAPAWFLRGRLASASDDQQAALELYARAATLDPTFFKARYNHGLLALRLGRPEAQQIFARLTVDFPKRAEPLFNLGRIAYRTERYEEATKFYSKAIALREGRYPEAKLNLAITLRADHKLDQALAVLDELIALDRNNAAAHLNRGLVLKSLGEDTAARSAFEQAAAVKPNYATAFYNLGKLDSQLGDHKAAAADYRDALAADSKHAKSALNLGVELGALGDSDGAVSAFRQAITIAPRYGAAWSNLGRALRKKKDYQGAGDALQRVIDIEPDNVRARDRLGIIYSKLGQPELALREFNEVLDREPQRTTTRYNLTIQLGRLDRVDEQARELERVLKLKPTHRKAALALARLHLDRGEALSAIDVLERQSAAEHPKVRVLTTLTRAQLMAGDRRAANETLARARSLYPDDPNTLAVAAEVALDGLRTAEARALYRRSARIDPNNYEVLRLRARLGGG